MKFGVRPLALCCLLRRIWCYPVFSAWNSACSPRTLECMRVWYLATHHGNYTRGGVCIGRWQWQHSASDRTPNSSEPQIFTSGFSAGCQNSRQAQSVANSSFALPAWMLHGRQMAPIQLESITMLIKKLLVGHTRSISGPILRGRDFILTTPSILYENICCLWWVRHLCTSPCGMPRLPLASFYVGSPRCLSPADRTKRGGK